MKEKELKDILRKDFNFEENWKPLFSLLFSKVQYFSSPSNPFSENEKVKSGKQTGIVKLDDGKSIAIFEVEVDDHIRIDRNRQGLREIAIRHIDQNITHGAFVFFYSKKQADYRFSFIAKWSELDLETGELKKGETKAKRYTYLLGHNEACTTAAKRLLILIERKANQNTGIKEIVDAFSVESLNKEFFKTYKEHYEKFWRYIASPDNGFRNILLDTSEEKTPEQKEKPIRDFAKKLLGRIVFLHFLQKKGWMGCPANTSKWENGEKKFMQQLFADFNNKSHFHSRCLTRLFFNTLNTRRPNDIFEIKGLNGKLNGSRVPYLNGGLFDADKPEEVLTIDFPEKYFAELLEFFEQYNFTIDENSPDDHEVGIDPEMLGHIFENLLEENREKGAFYTPKEVVQYMCQESLLQYLRSHLSKYIEDDSSASKALENFIRNDIIGNRHDKKNFVVQQARRIEKLLDNVKICDPAIGSGAFPMGMLQEIFKAKTSLDLTLDLAEVKRQIIQNNIHGVDIEPGAVDIARLRFWLALVVDETEPQPLPNLDYKIMQGNSLLEQFEDISLKFERKVFEVKVVKEVDLFGKPINPQYTINEYLQTKQSTKEFDITELEEKYFNSNNSEEKHQIREKIESFERQFILEQLNERENKLKELLQYKENDFQKDLYAFGKAKAEYLSKGKKAKDIEKHKAELEKVRQNRKRLNEIKPDEKPWFLWHLYFMDVFDKDGFDIVIGNPPYGAKLSSDDKYLFKQMYEDVHMRTPDSFNYFISKSLKVLNDNGVLSFIVPNNLLYQNENTKTRSLLINDHQLKSVINLGDNTFESADVPTCIFVALKKPKTDYILQYSDFRNEHIKNIPFFTPMMEIEKSELNQVPDLVLGVSSHSIHMMQTIESQSWKIEEIALEVASGISTGGDKIFRVTKSDAKKLQLEEDLLRPVLVGGEIDKYKIQDTEHLVLYLDRTTKINNYPNTKSYLKEFKTQLEKRSETKLGIMPWYAMNRHRYPKLFEDEKILMRQTSDSIRAAFDVNGFYAIDSLLILKLQPECEVSYKFVLTILNSKLNNYNYKNLTQEEGRVFAQVKPQNVRKLFIPKISPKEQEVFEVLCDYLMFLYDNKNPVLSSLIPNTHIAKIFEEVVDGCVYESYFGEHMRERGIDILSRVRETIKPIENIKSKAGKAETINDVFQQLRKSENQIRNRIQLFVSSSPEFLKEIIQR